MVRQLRIELAGAVYHVTSRGNARQKIFRDDQDYEQFLEIVPHVCARLRQQIYLDDAAFVRRILRGPSASANGKRKSRRTVATQDLTPSVGCPASEGQPGSRRQRGPSVSRTGCAEIGNTSKRHSMAPLYRMCRRVACSPMRLLSAGLPVST